MSKVAAGRKGNFLYLLISYNVTNTLTHYESISNIQLILYTALFMPTGVNVTNSIYHLYLQSRTLLRQSSNSNNNNNIHVWIVRPCKLLYRAMSFFSKLIFDCVRRSRNVNRIEQYCVRVRVCECVLMCVRAMFAHCIPHNDCYGKPFSIKHGCKFKLNS